MKIYNSVAELIGNTPLLRLNNLEKSLGLKCAIYAKLEGFNPAGSAKDRIALSMLDGAKEQGLLKDGGTVIEPTSGNTGIALAMLCSARGYNCIIVMPDTMSKERINLIKGYGAKVVLTDGKLGMKGAIDKAVEIQKATPNSIIAGQFDNPLNRLAHYKTTGPEIFRDTDGDVDFLIAGVGTGGTLSGTGKFLKENISTVKVVGVEPDASPLISKGFAGPHKIQGIGANFIPSNFDATVCDQIMTVTNDDAFKFCHILAKTEGLLCGISSGATLCGAVKLAKTTENKKIVAVLTDLGERYLSVDGYIE